MLFLCIKHKYDITLLNFISWLRFMIIRFKSNKQKTTPINGIDFRSPLPNFFSILFTPAETNRYLIVLNFHVTSNFQVDIAMEGRMSSVIEFRFPGVRQCQCLGPGSKAGLHSQNHQRPGCLGDGTHWRQQ